jgi:hypothetical protein
VKTILEITTTVGAAVDGEAVEVVESCTSLAAMARAEGAEAEVKQYITSKLLVCQALIKVSSCSKVGKKTVRDTNLGQQTLLLDAMEKVE